MANIPKKIIKLFFLKLEIECSENEYDYFIDGKLKDFSKVAKYVFDKSCLFLTRFGDTERTINYEKFIGSDKSVGIKKPREKLWNDLFPFKYINSDKTTKKTRDRYSEIRDDEIGKYLSKDASYIESLHSNIGKSINRGVQSKTLNTIALYFSCLSWEELLKEEEAILEKLKEKYEKKYIKFFIKYSVENSVIRKTDSPDYNTTKDNQTSTFQIKKVIDDNKDESKDINKNKKKWYKLNTIKGKFLWSIAALLFLCFVFFSVRQFIKNTHQKFPESVNGILIMAFEGDDDNKIQNDLVYTLNEEISDSLNIEVRPYKKSISINQGNSNAHNVAREIGKNYKNTALVIWGSIRKGIKVDSIKYHLRITIVNKPNQVFPGEYSFPYTVLTELDLPSEIVNISILLTNYIVGLNYLFNHNYSLALKHIEEIASFDVANKYQSSDILAMKALCLISLFFEKRPVITYLDPVVKICNEAITLNPQNIFAYSIRSQCWFLIGNYSKALRDINTVFTIIPNAPHINFQRGTIYYFEGQYKLALEEFKLACKKLPDNPSCYFYKGQTYKNLDSLDKAIVDFEHVILINENYLNAYLELGDIFYARKEYLKAIQYYSKTTNIDSTNCKGFIGKGKVYLFGLNDLYKSVKCFEQALKIESDNLEALINIGYALFVSNEITDAKKYLLKAFEVDSTNYTPLYFLGRINSIQQNSNEAIAFLQKASKIDSGSYITWYRLGCEYSIVKNHELAINYFKIAKTIDSTKFELWFNIGNEYLYTKQKVKAINSYIKAVELCDNDFGKSNILALIGLQYFSLKQYLKAIDYYEKSLESFPNNVNKAMVLNNLCLCYIIFGEVRKAETTAQLSILEESFDRGSMLLGHVYVLLKDYEMANEYYLKSYESYSSRKDFFKAFYEDYIIFILEYHKSVGDEYENIIKRIKKGIKDRFLDINI